MRTKGPVYTPPIVKRAWGQNWWFCPACASAFNKEYKRGCYCKLDEETGSYVPTALVRFPDQDAAESAYLLGGVLAVYALAEELKRNA